MAYKPPTFETKFSNVYGQAKILGVGKNQIKLVFRESKGKGESGKTENLIIKKDNAPEYVQKGIFHVSMDSDRTQIFNMRPGTGMFTVKVQKFVANEDQPPTPKTKEYTGTNGKFTIQSFAVILEITDGDYKGMEILYNLRYSVSEEIPMYDWVEMKVKGKEKRVLAHPNSRSKYLAQLIEFENVTGVWEKGPIFFTPTYSDNVLPVLEKRILEADREFNVVLKDGWVDTIYQEMQDDFEDEEFSDEPEEDLPEDALEEGVDDVTDGPEHPLEDPDFVEYGEEEAPEDEELPWNEEDEELEEDFDQDGFE